MRLIDADVVVKGLNRWKNKLIPTYGENDEFVRCIDRIIDEYIDSEPTIDAEPVRHGHWNDAYPDIEPNPMFMYGICSECGFEQGLSNKLHYCPNCGAKMDEVSE